MSEHGTATASSDPHGYSISGNLAEETGRKYQVYDAFGDVIHTTDSKRKAMDFAESLPLIGEPEEHEEEEPDDGDDENEDDPDKGDAGQD